MKTIKSYTYINQSKKLAEILPIESADMCYLKREINDTFIEVPISKPKGTIDRIILCCWSLAALLNIMPKEIVYKGNIVFLEFHIWENSLEYTNGGGYTLCATESYDNPVDACVAMIEKLHELKML